MGGENGILADIGVLDVLVFGPPEACIGHKQHIGFEKAFGVGSAIGACYFPQSTGRVQGDWWRFFWRIDGVGGFTIFVYICPTGGLCLTRRSIWTGPPWWLPVTSVYIDASSPRYRVLRSHPHLQRWTHSRRHVSYRNSSTNIVELGARMFPPKESRGVAILGPLWESLKIFRD